MDKPHRIIRFVGGEFEDDWAKRLRERQNEEGSSCDEVVEGEN